MNDGTQDKHTCAFWILFLFMSFSPTFQNMLTATSDIIACDSNHIFEDVTQRECPPFR